MKKYEKKFEHYEKINECTTFGEFLANLRKYYKLTQPQLGEKLNINYKAISKWENDTNFPDVGIHKNICEIFNITLDEFYNGKIDIEFRKKDVRSKILNRIIIFICIVLLPSIIFFCHFLWKNYDTLNLYSIVQSDTYDSIEVDGLFIDYQDSDLLYIGSIKLLDFKVKDTDIINIEFLYNNDLFYTSNVLNNIYVVVKENIAKNISNFEIKIRITRNGTIAFEENVVLKAKLENLKDYEMPFYKKETEKLKKTEIKNKLIDDDFKETDKDVFYKTWKDKNSKKSITIFLDTKRISYIEENELLSINLTYKGENNILEANIVQIYNNIRMIMEKYIYNYETENLSCDTKSCDSYVDVLKVMEPYVSLFISDLKSP